MQFWYGVLLLWNGTAGRGYIKSNWRLPTTCAICPGDLCNNCQRNEGGSQKAISSDRDSVTFWRCRKQKGGEWKKISNIIQPRTRRSRVISLSLCLRFNTSGYLMRQRILRLGLFFFPPGFRALQLVALLLLSFDPYFEVKGEWKVKAAAAWPSPESGTLQFLCT